MTDTDPDIRVLGLFNKLCDQATALARELDRVDPESPVAAHAQAVRGQIEISAEALYPLDAPRISHYAHWAINARSERILALFPDREEKDIILAEGEMGLLLRNAPLSLLNMAVDKGLQAGDSLAEIFAAIEQRPEIETFVLERLAAAAAARCRRYDSALKGATLRWIDHPAFAGFLRSQASLFPVASHRALSVAVREEDCETIVMLLLAGVSLDDRSQIEKVSDAAARTALEQCLTAHGRIALHARTGGLEAYITRAVGRRCA